MSRRFPFAKLAPLAPVAALAVVVALANGAAHSTDSTHDQHMNGMHEVQVPAAASVPLATPVDRSKWTVSASDQEVGSESAPASAAIDGNTSTFWHSKWSNPATPLPHWITIDTHETVVVSAVTYVPRPAASANGRIGRFTVTVSADGTNWSDPVATGTWADDSATKTASFAQQATRFVRLTALSEAGNRGPWTTAAELNLLGASSATPTQTGTLPRTGWTANASDAETGSENGAASNVLDGDAATFWHSKWSNPATPLPHWITIDMRATAAVSGLSYLPRPAASPNGRIGRFTVTTSTDGTKWSDPVVTGTWADDASAKTVSFPEQSVRYVRLNALTEAGGRAPYSSAAEINLVGPVPAPGYATLSRSGWTAAASDAETAAENGAAGNVLDGNAATFWHSKWSNPATPLPHSITLDMKTTASVAGLRYLPRPGGGNGTIGSYKVSTSTNGTTFTDAASGTWADSAAEKTATFAEVTARYVRLTGITEAGNRAPYSSAAEINVLGRSTSTPPSTTPSTGSWGPVINFPIVPVSAVVLPGNKLLTFSAYSPNAFTSNGSTTDPNGDSYTQTAILDLATNVVSQRTITNTGHQMFCTGLAILPDGRVLVDGASDSGATSIYSPATDTWSKGPRLNIPRGYQGDTTLSTGEVFTLGGSWNGGTGGKDAEVYTPNGTWRKVPNVTANSILTQDPQGIYRSDNHGWFFAVGNGGVFHAGPSKQMNWFTTAGNGSTTSAGLRGDSADAMNGNAVMYDIGKILAVGGATAYQDTDASKKAYTIDISRGPGQPVTTNQTGSMANARAFGNGVVLPDGKVLVVGGQSHPVPFTDDGAALAPELWDPVTGTFTTLASMAKPRTYHSVALLLPDGRVFSGGGGLCGGCATNHPDGQIFTPPYLLNSDGSARTRPTLSAAPDSAALGSTISVTATAGLSKFVLVRTGATTHTVNSDQRRVPISVASADGTSYRLNIPSDSGVALPGYYMLFALDSFGTPSVSKMIRVG